MKKIKIYLSIITTFCFFGVFMRTQYAPDTYFVFSDTTDSVIGQFYSCGRFVTGFVLGLCKDFFNLNDNFIYTLSYILAMICTIFSIYRLSNLINKDIQKNKISLLLSVLVIINIFSFELFVYIEKGIMMFSVFLSILAIEQVNKYFENNKIRYLLGALVYLLIATCSYQGTIGIFVSISTIYIIKYSKTIRDFIANNIKVFIVYGIPSIINFIMVRFVINNSRIEGDIVPLESVRKVLEGIKSLFITTYNLFPKYLFLIYIIGVTIFLVYKLIFDKNKTLKIKILKILGVIYIFTVTLFVTIAPQIIQNTKSIWFVARSSYPMASIFGILLIYMYCECNVKKIEEKILINICLLFLIIQLFFFMRFGIDGYIVNYKDKLETMKIIRQIEQIEKETGTMISKIAFYYDRDRKYVYSDIKASGDINIRAFSKDWVAKAIINYYSGRNLKTIKSNKILQENFSKENWNEYNEKQIILEGETIHLCLY